MQVATSRRCRKSPLTAVAPATAGRACESTELLADLSGRARENYLEALPIPAAIICRGTGEAASVQAANTLFRSVAGLKASGAVSADDVLLLNSGQIGEQLKTFLGSGEEARQFEGQYGPAIGRRHFEVRLARLGAAASRPGPCLISLVDRTAEVESGRTFRAEMMRDSLTGLPNRFAFNEKVEATLQRAGFAEGSHAVLAIDVVRFSRINESMGAIAGDELLITFARRILSTLDAGDVLARTGGNEFAILTGTGRGLPDALQLAGRIQLVLAAPFRLSELEIRVDCSVGCASLTRAVTSSEEVLRNAQFALKRSKQTGRPQVYEPVQAQAAKQRFSLETDLRRAIERDELTLAFQPLIDLKTGAVSGFEALARWNHPERGAVSPAEFIPVAEESGLILALGRWALHAAAQTLAGWDREVGRTLPFPVSVNLSAIQIARDDIACAVASALKVSGISGDRLTMELTESAIVQDPQRATLALESLRAFDTKVAMDDFGTGYTSLGYLQRLPIDVLKIDRSLVTAMLEDEDSVAIIRAILSLAEALGMATTAEGIETQEVAKALTDLGCSHGQGFHFAKPLAPDAALAYWLERNS
jgi:diguanylate cyclase (GGDEF)-like protein